jgi:hypothetical protein
MGVDGQRHALHAVPTVNRPGTNCAGCWMGPRTGMNGCGKSPSSTGFDPRTIQPVAGRYTEWAIPAYS